MGEAVGRCSGAREEVTAMTMRVPLRTAAAVAVLCAAGLVAGCSSQSTSGSVATTSATPTTSTSSTEPAPTGTSSVEPSASGAAGCRTVVQATTKNAALLSAATGLFESMDCTSSTPLSEQLTAAFEAPAFQAQAKAAGWTVALNKVDVGGGSTAVSIVDLATRSSCQVQAIADPLTKGLLCGDT